MKETYFSRNAVNNKSIYHNILLTESNNQFRNYESKFSRIFDQLKQVLQVLQVLFSLLSRKETTSGPRKMRFLGLGKSRIK